MTTFSQFLKNIEKSPEPKPITWVCGTEDVLVEEVVAHVCNYLSPEPWNKASFRAGDDSDRSIWAAIDQHPMGTSPRVVVIRHVENIQTWDPFITWVKDRGRNPRTYLVLVSAEEQVPKTVVTPEQRRRGEKPVPLPHIAVIGNKGHVIECRPFTTATASRSVTWVQSKVPMRDNVAKHLLVRANWDLRLVRDTCLKLAAFQGDVTIAVINSLMSEQPRDTFVDALLALDRKTALLAAERIHPEDIGRVIGLLDAALDTAGKIHDMQVNHKTAGEMAKALGSKAFLLQDLLLVAKHYDSKRRLAIRKVLSVVDEAYRNHQRIGLLETIVTFW